MFAHLLIVCLIITQGVLAQIKYLSQYRAHESCDFWAETDGECVNNPRFMWSSCLGSCLQFAQDVEEMCPTWAAEGECTNNPNYIHIHCPRSCNYAIAWNPWVRNQLGISQIPVEQFSDEEDPVDLLSIIRIMHRRLHVYFNDYNSNILGLSSFSPSDYSAMVGVTEIFLFTLRLQEVVLQKIQSPHSKELQQNLEVIISLLKSGYDSDRIMRAIPTWMPFVESASDAIKSHVEKGELVSPIALSEMVKYFRGFDGPAEINANTVDSASIATTHRNLANGVSMPMVGLGTWLLEGDECYLAVFDAIKSGYRHFDTAQAYRNEEAIGRAIKATISQGLVKREDLFIATKLSDPSNAGYDNTYRLIRSQLEALQTTYIDLYMLHSPLDDSLQAETWKALEEMYNQGTLKALGVSNFDTRELGKLLTYATVKPMVVQNKLDVYHVGKQIDPQGDEIVKFTKENSIILVSYSPFSAYPFVMEASHDPIINYIAKERSKKSGKVVSPAQIILKWLNQRGIASIPRSININRQADNLNAIQIPSLTEYELALVESLQMLVSSPVSVPITIL